MRMRRLVAPAFLVPLVSTLWIGGALAQPPPAPAPAVEETKDVPPTSPPPAAPAPPVATIAPAGAAIDASRPGAAERAGEGNTFVVGRWATTLYGFVEGDVIHDSTQSLNEIAGNTQIARAGTFAGDHDRTQLSIRNSRLGLRIKAPETGGVRASAQLEMDFFGGAAPASGAEATVYSNAVLRVRHMNLKLETPIVDILVGQYWTLYGWQAQYLPATVEIQGVPGGIFSRQVQVRVSKTVKTSRVTFEAAVAAVRPPQRDGALPAGQAGLRLALDGWTAPQTANFAGTTIQPLSIAVTGDVRRLRLPELSASPTETRAKSGASLAVDAFVPVIPGAKDSRGNSLALNGELSTGYGSGDMYTGLNGGVANPALPVPAGATAAPAFDAHIDGGIALYDAQGNLHLVQWTAFVVGAQYYLPGSGTVFVSANYARATSANTGILGAAARTRDAEDWFDVNVFWDVTPAVRVAAEYASFRDTYNDGAHATNQRVQASAAFLF